MLNSICLDEHYCSDRNAIDFSSRLSDKGEQGLFSGISTGYPDL